MTSCAGGHTLNVASATNNTTALSPLFALSGGLHVAHINVAHIIKPAMTAINGMIPLAADSPSCAPPDNGINQRRRDGNICD